MKIWFNHLISWNRLIALHLSFNKNYVYVIVVRNGFIPNGINNDINEAISMR